MNQMQTAAAMAMNRASLGSHMHDTQAIWNKASSLQLEQLLKVLQFHTLEEAESAYTASCVDDMMW